jgi:hypothetical protein
MALIPGQDLLAMAMTVIAQQDLSYYKYAGRVLNSLGQYVSTYSRGVVMSGSWQPVPRNLMIQYGLDFQKSYFTFYTSNNVVDLTRDVSADQLAFNGERYQVESNNDWFALDGWKGILCVHIGPDTQQENVFGFGTIPNSNTYSNFYQSNFLGSDIN